jgi:hypothetical protein
MATQIDDNFKNVDLAVDDDITGAISPLLVDPVTGRLLIGIEIVASFNDLDVSSKIDENFEGVAMAVDDDATAKIKPLKIDPTNGGLICDILI